MKAKNALLILIPLYTCLLLSLFSYQIFVNYTENIFYKKLRSLPILAYSFEIRYLNNLQTQFETNNNILSITIIPANQLKKELIEKYNINNNELTQNSKLPNLMLINFKGKSKIEYLKIVQSIRLVSSNILIDYNSSSLDVIFHDISLLKQISAYLLYAFSFLVGMIIYFSRIFYEFKNNEYWKIYVRAGGNPEKRRHNFMSQNLLLYVFSLLISGLVFYLVNNYFNNNLDYLNLNYLVIICTPIPALLLSQLYLGREL